MSGSEGTAGALRVVTGRGSIASALASARVDWPAEATLTWWPIGHPVLVLGSAQPSSDVDHAAADRAGVEVCRRASGGGAVLLAPEDVLWCDLVITPGHPRWDEDVVRAAAWVGDAAGAALRSVLDPLTAATVCRHEGGLVRTRWSDLVCFAGRGPGEVCLGNAKVVGISQRRSRHGVRFQIAVLRRWDSAGIAGLLRVERHERDELAHDLADVATGVNLPPGRIIDAFTTAFG